MPVSKKPAISERRVADSATMGVLSNIRQRIEQIEALLATVEAQTGQNTLNSAERTATLSNLQSQISQLAQVVSTLEDLLNSGDEGIIVLVDGALIVRELEAGDNVTIDNPDGVDGNPVINSSGGGYPFLTDNQDTDILTNNDLRIRVE